MNGNPGQMSINCVSAAQAAKMSLGSEPGIRNPACGAVWGLEVCGSLIAERTDSRLRGSLIGTAL